MRMASFLQREKRYLNRLSKEERRLLLSFTLYGFAAPMTAVFSNTFLWRETGDPVILTLYNLAFFVGLPAGFLLNAYLLRHVKTARLYALGCFLQGLVPIGLVFLNPSGAVAVFGLGLFLGISGGFFWANRNLLTSKATEGEHRYSFISLETVFGTVADLIAPITIGWFLVLGDWFRWYSVGTAYRICAVAGFFILVLAARAAWRTGVETITTAHIFLAQPSALWRRWRWVEMIHGSIGGLESVVPLVLILSLVGSEETVGTINFIVALLTIAIMYTIGKFVRHRDHLLILTLWIVCALLGTGAVAVLWNAVGVIIYYFINGFADSFRWGSFATVMYELVDREVQRTGKHRFVFLLDREFFLNIGRVLTLLVFLFCYHKAPEITLRFSLLTFVLLQLPLRALVKPILHSLSHQTIPLPVRLKETFVEPA